MNEKGPTDGKFRARHNCGNLDPGWGRGISIIRVSGDQALDVVSRIFKGKDLHQVKSHTINYGHIIDPASGETVDEVMVSVMLAPKTYTKEDVVEINCHGGCWRLTGPYN